MSLFLLGSAGGIASFPSLYSSCWVESVLDGWRSIWMGIYTPAWERRWSLQLEQIRLTAYAWWNAFFLWLDGFNEEIKTQTTFRVFEYSRHGAIRWRWLTNCYYWVSIISAWLFIAGTWISVDHATVPLRVILGRHWAIGDQPYRLSCLLFAFVMISAIWWQS